MKVVQLYIEVLAFPATAVGSRRFGMKFTFPRIVQSNIKCDPDSIEFDRSLVAGFQFFTFPIDIAAHLDCRRTEPNRMARIVYLRWADFRRLRQSESPLCHRFGQAAKPSEFDRSLSNRVKKLVSF
jgi:hypothetical protein